MNQEEKMQNECIAWCDKVHKLSKQMHDYLVDVVNENGGYLLVEPRNKFSTMYCYLMDEELSETTEYPILALAVFNDNQLCVLPDETKGRTTLKGMSTEEILAMDEWEQIYGGMILINATLYSICENITEYYFGGLTD